MVGLAVEIGVFFVFFPVFPEFQFFAVVCKGAKG